MMDIVLTPKKLKGTVSAPPSKSCLHRSLICSSLANEKTVIENISRSDDINATIECLQSLGTKIVNSFTVFPMKKKTKAILDVSASGSTLRFMLPIVGALGINSTFIGDNRLCKRPLDPLYNELVSHDCSLSKQGIFPLVINGKLSHGDYNIKGDISSQFISGLLLALPLLEGDSRIIMEQSPSARGYINLTLSMLKKFGIRIDEDDHSFIIKGKQKYISPKILKIEGDWSNAAFFLAAKALGNDINVIGLDESSLQGDKAIMRLLKDINTEIDVSDTPDLVPILALVAALSTGKTHLYNAQRLRFKESDRLASIVEVLSQLGADIRQEGDGLIIFGKSRLAGGVVHSHADHRIAMTAAIASTVCEKPVVIKNCDAVTKSYPEFFEILGGLSRDN